MLIKRTRGWELPETQATPEAIYLNRRALVKAMGLGAARSPLPGDRLGRRTRIRRPASTRPSATTSTACPRRSPPRSSPTTYNNFYEFGTDKSIWRDAQKLPIRPWTIKVGGMVEKPFEIGIDDLLAKMPLEERVYRHRCVEAWSMIVPWSGFPMSSLVELCKPTGEPPSTW